MSTLTAGLQQSISSPSNIEEEGRLLLVQVVHRWGRAGATLMARHSPQRMAIGRMATYQSLASGQMHHWDPESEGLLRQWHCIT